jgi:hypothetical protein
MCPFWDDYLHVGQTWLVYKSGEVTSPDVCISEVVTCDWSWNLTGSAFTETSCDTIPDVSWCTLPWGWFIASWDSITWYPSSSVPCKQSCWIKTTATCLGNNNWSGDADNARYPNCDPDICGWWGWWGGSYTPTCELEDLVCVDGEYQEKDGVNCRGGDLWETCDIDNQNTGWSTNHTYDRIWDISNSPYDNELNLAYLYAYNMWITDMETIQKADMMWNLVRSHMAKMLVNWSKEVLWLQANTWINCEFDDIDNLIWKDLYDYVIQACQMWLMWLDNDWNPKSSFSPNSLVTRAQFGTVLSRAIWWSNYNGWDPYYKDHLDALKSVDIMTKIEKPYSLELRWWVMLMLLRTDQDIN